MLSNHIMNQHPTTTRVLAVVYLLCKGQGIDRLYITTKLLQTKYTRFHEPTGVYSGVDSSRRPATHAICDSNGGKTVITEMKMSILTTILLFGVWNLMGT